VPGRPEYSSGGRLVHRSVASASHVATVVPAVRLDDATTAESIEPSCIVMDCEGGEYNALRGAAGILTSSQPTVVMEFDPPLLEANGGSATALLGFLAGLGYRCIALADPPIEVDESFCGSVVAVPESRADATARVIADTFSMSRRGVRDA